MRHHKHIDLVKSAVKHSINHGKINPTKVRQITKSFTKLPRLDALNCLKDYLLQLGQEVKKHTLTIETATPLSSSQVQTIKRTMAKNYSIDQVKVIKNRSLLGGIKVRIGDDLYEDTLQSRIAQLKGAIAN